MRGHFSCAPLACLVQDVKRVFPFQVKDIYRHYGRFSLIARVNFHQVGLALVNGMESTWEEIGAMRVLISQPFPGLEKRQCTVNACIEAGHKFPRWQGRRRPRVDAFFQGGLKFHGIEAVFDSNLYVKVDAEGNNEKFW